MVNFVIRTGVVWHIDTETQTALEIHYQNIRSVSTKQTELLGNVCYVEIQFICLNEACLNDNCYYHKIFPNSLTIVHSDTVSINKSSAAVLTAVLSQLCTYKSRCDLQFMTNCLGGNFHPKWPQFTD